MKTGGTGTEPLPPPTATGVRIAGDRYQWLVAWQVCVAAVSDDATHADNPVIAVGVEVDDAGNVDDVVTFRRRPPHTYRQVKYAVNSESPVNAEYLTAPSKSGGPSILGKLALAWRRLTAQGDPIEMALVTNRAPDANDPLISGRDARTRRLRPNADRDGPRSARGKARAAWAQAAGLSETQLLQLLTVLDFDLARDRSHLEEAVKRDMLLAGLRGDDASLAAGADWVAEQVVAGQRHILLTAIKAGIDERELRAGPARVVVSVATLAPDPLAVQARHAIDWVDRFEGADAFAKRHPQAPATWQQLQSEIEGITAHLAGVSHVAVTGSLRQATAFTLGAALRMVTHTDVAVIQRGVLWTSETPYEAPIAPTVGRYDVAQGDELAVAVAVAVPIAEDVLAFLRSQRLPVDQLVVLGPPGGPRDSAIDGPVTACALAVGIRDAVRRAVSSHLRVHLFLGGPMGLALLLGHRWNRIAPTVVYEDLAALGYEPAFTVSA